MNFDDRIKLDIFEGKTTYSNDYRKLPLNNKIQNLYEPDCIEVPLKKEKGRPFDFKYKPTCHETFTKFRKNVHIPFDLFWRKTEKDDPKLLMKPVDYDKEESIRTRPRLYIAPAVSIDDVNCKASRNLLLDFMYTTDFRRAEREAISPTYNINELNNNTHCKSEIKNYQKLFDNQPSLFPELPEDLRENYAIWDKQQKRASTDPTYTFWKTKDPPVKCSVCDNTLLEGSISEDCRKEINELIETNSLNRQYDRMTPGYAGYKMENARGIPMRATLLPIHHPLLTTSNQVTRRYEDDMIQSKQNEQNIKY